MAGSVFAGYRIERVLGAGGMGTVYLGRNPDLPRFEAIKVLSSELSRDAEFRARFLREADVAAGLDHPNVVSIFGRGEFGGQLWIAMQFVDGIDADGALQDGAMTPVRAVHIVSEVAKALDYAHSRQVVHRDVKPGNFLLSGLVGPDERVLLGDFGIARAIDDAKLTATGSFMATVSYAAPEVLAGQPFDGRADLYSLGCTLFRLLSGEPPFASANGVAAVLAAHLTAPPPRVSDRVPELSMRMDQVIAKAMAKDPGERFDSAGKFAAAAAQALDETTVALRPVPAAAVAPYAPPPTLNGTQGFQQHGAVYPPALFPGPPRPRRGRWIAAGAALLAVVAVAVGATLVLRSQHQHEAAPKPTTTAAAPPKSPLIMGASALPGLLLTPQQAAAIVGAPAMKVLETTNAVSDDSSSLIVEKDCIGAFGVAQRVVYGGTGWTAAQEQSLVADKSAGRMSLTQAVIAYPSAAAAQKVVADQVPLWTACSGRTITVHRTNNRADAPMLFGPVVNTDGILSMTQTSPIPNGFQFGVQRTLTARGNIVIDVAVDHAAIANQGMDVLNAIAAKIPR
jgi:eukaryotic-like serine/threonine-protein kinase